MGAREIEAEIIRLRPDIVPLRIHPRVQARKHVSMCPEGQDVGMKQWPGRRVVHGADVTRKCLQPLEEPGASRGVGFWQRGHSICSSCYDVAGASAVRRRDRQSLARAAIDVSAMNRTDAPNTQRGRSWSMIQPPINGPIVPPILNPVVTIPNTRPNAPGGEAERTSMSREGAIMPDSRPARPIAAISRMDPRLTEPTSKISTAA